MPRALSQVWGTRSGARGRLYRDCEGGDEVRIIAIVAAMGLVAGAATAQRFGNEPIFTAHDLYTRCAGNEADRRLCFAYIRGFSDGNRWLLTDRPGAALGPREHAVCIPNAEPIATAADLFVARFKGRASELQKLSPYRALSAALANRYPCE